MDEEISRITAVEQINYTITIKYLAENQELPRGCPIIYVVFLKIKKKEPRHHPPPLDWMTVDLQVGRLQKRKGHFLHVILFVA